MSLNKVMIIGNLGADPEVRHTQSGATVCNLRVATTEKWTDKGGERQEKTQWHNVVVWGKLAEQCGEYLSKGRSVYVEGSLGPRPYEQDGVKKYATDIKAQRVQFLGGGDRSSNPRDGYRNAKPSGSSGGWGSRAQASSGGWGDAPKQASPGQGNWGDGDPIPF